MTWSIYLRNEEVTVNHRLFISEHATEAEAQELVKVMCEADQAWRTGDQFEIVEEAHALRH